MEKRREACSDCVANGFRRHKKAGTSKRRFCFFKVMLGDFAKQLMIPPAFVKHIKNEDSNKVILEGPSEKLWNLTLEKTAKGMFLQRGWEKFVKDHSIRLGEFLVFQYSGDLHFTVKIFDTTACEKEDAFCVENGEGPIFNKEKKEKKDVKAELTQKKNGRGRSRKRPRVENDECSILYKESKEKEEVKVKSTQKKRGWGWTRKRLRVENDKGPNLFKENKEQEKVKVESTQKRGRGRPKKESVPMQVNSNSTIPKKVLVEQENKSGTTVLGSSELLDKLKHKSRATVLDSSGQLLNCDSKRLDIGLSSSEKVKVEPTRKKNGRGRPRRVSVPIKTNSKSIMLKKVSADQENKSGTTSLGLSGLLVKQDNKSRTTVLDSSAQLLNCDFKRLDIGPSSSEEVKAEPTRKKNGRGRPRRVSVAIKTNSKSIKKVSADQENNSGTTSLGSSGLLAKQENKSRTTVFYSSGLLLNCDSKRLDIGPSNSEEVKVEPTRKKNGRGQPTKESVPIQFNSNSTILKNALSEQESKSGMTILGSTGVLAQRKNKSRTTILDSSNCDSKRSDIGSSSSEEVKMEPTRKKNGRGRPRKESVPIQINSNSTILKKVSADQENKSGTTILGSSGLITKQEHKNRTTVLYSSGQLVNCDSKRSDIEPSSSEEVKVEPTQKKNGKGRPRNKSIPIQINSNSIILKKVLADKEKKSRNSILDSSRELRNCDTKKLDIGSSGSCFASKGNGVRITSEYKCTYYMSLRRPVTKEEKARAYEAACSFKSSRLCAQVVMTTSHVYMGFFVQLPTKFVRTHFPQESRYINLRCPSGKKWCVHYIYKEGKGSLSGGWGSFSLENNLEEGDVCVLERVDPGFDFNVHIFRVVANPSSKLPIPQSGKSVHSKRSLPKALFAELK